MRGRFDLRVSRFSGTAEGFDRVDGVSIRVQGFGVLASGVCWQLGPISRLGFVHV